MVNAVEIVQPKLDVDFLELAQPTNLYLSERLTTVNLQFFCNLGKFEG
jgi:hypothetical protein